jgi:hypothetical protein
MKPMVVYSCEKHDQIKCKCNSPCMAVLPGYARFNKKTCPNKKGKGKFKVLPTTELTV